MNADQKPVVSPSFWRGVKIGAPIGAAMWLAIIAVIVWLL